jgi:hypothetical protein
MEDTTPSIDKKQKKEIEKKDKKAKEKKEKKPKKEKKEKTVVSSTSSSSETSNTPQQRASKRASIIRTLTVNRFEHESKLQPTPTKATSPSFFNGPSPVSLPSSPKVNTSGHAFTMRGEVKRSTTTSNLNVVASDAQPKSSSFAIERKPINSISKSTPTSPITNASSNSTEECSTPED